MGLYSRVARVVYTQEVGLYTGVAYGGLILRGGPHYHVSLLVQAQVVQ